MSELRDWYLRTFNDGRHLEGRELRDHVRATLQDLEALRKRTGGV